MFARLSENCRPGIAKIDRCPCRQQPHGRHLAGRGGGLPEQPAVRERETLPFLALPLPFCQRLMPCVCRTSPHPPPPADPRRGSCLPRRRSADLPPRCSCRVTPAPYTDYFLQTAKTPVYSMSACEQMGLGYSHPPTDKCWNPIWNVANASMRDYFIDRLIKPLAAAPMIDGVFFDCFNFAYQLPSPWNIPPH